MIYGRGSMHCFRLPVAEDDSQRYGICYPHLSVARNTVQCFKPQRWVLPEIVAFARPFSCESFNSNVEAQTDKSFQYFLQPSHASSRDWYAPITNSPSLRSKDRYTWSCPDMTWQEYKGFFKTLIQGVPRQVRISKVPVCIHILFTALVTVIAWPKRPRSSEISSVLMPCFVLRYIKARVFAFSDE